MTIISKTRKVETRQRKLSEKLRKEATISRLLQQKFESYNLVEMSSPVKGFDCFIFTRFKKRGEWVNTTSITFFGPNFSDVCEKAKEYIRDLGHKVTDRKSNPHNGFLINLLTVEASSLKEDLLPLNLPNASEAKEKKPTSYDLELSVKSEDSLSKAKALVDRLHSSRLILGVQNKDKAFQPNEVGNVSVCWNYLNELEVAHTLYESENLFGYTPSTKKATRGEEVVIVWDLTMIPLDVDQRKFKVCKSRAVKELSISPVEVVDFLCRKIMRLNTAAYTPNSCTKEHPIGCFHVKDVVSRNEVFGWLDRFNITYLSSEKDGKCFWVALTDEMTSTFRACVAGGNIKPTDLIRKVKGGEIVPALTRTKTEKMGKTQNTTYRKLNREENPIWAKILDLLVDRKLSRRQMGKSNDYTANLNKDLKTISLGSLRERALSILKRDREIILAMQGVVDVKFAKGRNNGRNKGHDRVCYIVTAEDGLGNVSEKDAVINGAVSKVLTTPKKVWLSVLDILRSASLKIHHRGSDADYRTRSRFSRSIPLTSLSVKAKSFLRGNAHLFSGINGVKDSGFKDLNGQDSENFHIILDQEKMEKSTLAPSSVSVGRPHVITSTKTRSGAENMPSYVRMFMALSEEERMECLKQSGLTAGGRDESLNKLKGFFLIDASKGKSLHDVAKTLGALVKPEDIL